MFEKSTTEEIAEIKKQIEELTRKIGTVSQRAVGEFSEEAGSKMEDGWNALKDKGDMLKKKSREIYQDTDRYVNRNPWQAVGYTAAIAVAVGWLLSCLGHTHRDE